MCVFVQGIVNIGAVDMTAHQSVGGPYGIQGFPTIKIFGANKQKPTDYNGTYVHFVLIVCATFYFTILFFSTETVMHNHITYPAIN